MNRLPARILALALFSVALESAFAADFSGWNQRMRLTLTGYTQPETLTNFPVLVVFSNSPLFDYSQFLSGTNGDLRFTDATDNELPFEIEKWNTSGASFVWVRLPELADSYATIRAFWGKADEVLPDYTTNGAVWDDSHLGVWHMHQAAAADSTSNRFNGTAFGTVTPTTGGLIDGANVFDADVDYIAIPDSPRFNLTNDYTVSAWIRPDALADWQGFIGTYNATNGFIFTLVSVTNNWLGFWAGGQWRTNYTAGIRDGVWSQVAYRRQGTSGTFFINGAISGTLTNAAPGGDGGPLHLGAAGPGWAAQRYDGILDEVRLCTAAQSPAWMQASFLNQASNETFILAQPAGAPLIRNEAATGIVDTGAVFHATLVSTGDSPAAVTLHYGTTDAGLNLGAWEASVTVDGNPEAGALAIPVGGLLSNTFYFYTFSATNASGAFSASPSLSLKTFGPPVITNDPGPANITYYTALLRGTLLNGVTAQVSAVWGEAPESLTNLTSAFGTGEGTFSLPLSGLAENTAYFYRWHATNEYGEAWADSVAAFTTRLVTLVWTGASNALASNPANWSTGLAPLEQARIILADGNKPLTWDLDIPLASWLQEPGYSGVVTILTRYPGQGAFSNLVIAGSCVLSNGVWTHPANTGDTVARDRLSVSVGGDFILDPPARIDVTSRGFAGQRGPGAGSAAQRSQTSANTAVAASHGGVGGYAIGAVLPAGCYGSALYPETLGSGAWVAGGGAVRLLVEGEATVNGTILSTATDSSMHTMGSGGSILLVANAVTGTGRLDAAGGIGYWGGGGGRIAVIATNSASVGNLVLKANGGGRAVVSAAGTLYVETVSDGPGYGQLIIDASGIVPMSYTELPPSLESYPLHPAVGGELENVNLIVTNAGGRLKLTSSLRIGDFTRLHSGSSLDLNNRTLFVKASEPPLPFPQSYGGGTIATNNGRLLWGDQSATFRVGATNGPNGTVAMNPASPDQYYPLDTAVELTALPDPGCAFLWWEGDVPAGSNRTSNPLAVTADNTIEIRALFATNDANCRTWTGDGLNVLASNPTNWYPVQAPVAGNHVIFDSTSIKQCFWNLDVELGSWRQAPGYKASYSVVDGYKGWVTLQTRFPGRGSFTNLAIAGDVTLLDGTWTHPANTGTNDAFDRLAVTVGGDFTLGTNARIDVVSRGYAAGRGPGAGNALSRTGAGLGVSNGVAGSHGGRGGHGWNVPAALNYDSFMTPTNLGSGANVAGGGTILLTVEGQTLIDGLITANAFGSSDGGGTETPGAAGGSLLLTAGTLAGNGTLRANGAGGYWGGGGGRVAVRLTDGDDFGNVRMQAFGGYQAANSGSSGSAGTLYLERASDGPGAGWLHLNNNNYIVPYADCRADGPASREDLSDWSKVVLTVTNRAAFGLTTNLVMRDLFLRTNTPARLYLKGYTLRLTSLYHADWGNPAWVVYDAGAIRWPATGTVILLR